MTYKQIETSRETRLWLAQIIIPACTLAVTMAAHPEWRSAIVNKAESVKTFVKSKFKKQKES